MADLLAAAFLCEESARPCFICPACKRALAHTHPDIHYYTSAKKSIPVEDMRKIIDESAVTPYEGRFSVTILKDMHTATPEAQNCLLKTLEEPYRGHVFILLVENALLLLETIRSRCRLIRLTQQSESAILTQLELLYEDKAKCKQAADNCGGIIGEAISMMESSTYFQLQSLADKILSHIRNGESAYISSLLQQNKDDVPTILDILLNRLAHLLRQSNSPDKDTAYFTDSISLLNMIKSVQNAQIMLECNTNFGLTIDHLAYNLTKGANIWQR